MSEPGVRSGDTAERVALAEARSGDEARATAARWEPAEEPREITADAELGSQETVATPAGTQVETRDGTTTVTTADRSTVTVGKDGTVVVERPAMDPLAAGNGDRVASALAGEDVSTEPEQTTLTGDGSYRGPDGLDVTVQDGVVTITADGDEITVDADGTTSVDLSEDALEQARERAEEEARLAAEEAREKAEEEAEQAREEAEEEARKAAEKAEEDASAGGGPSGGGPSGGGPSGGGPSGGAPATGGPGGGPSDPTTPDQGSPADPGSGAPTMEVSPRALRADAGRWDTLADRFTEIHQGAGELELTSAQFGLAAPLHGGYEALVSGFTAMSSTGAAQFRSIATTLRRNADDYDRTESDNSAESDTITV